MRGGTTLRSATSPRATGTTQCLPAPESYLEEAPTLLEAIGLRVPRLGDFKSGEHQGYINAERARQLCAFVPNGEEEPGDLIFFEKTYNTAGASHVGIVIDPVRHIMADDHDRGNNAGPGETDYTKAKWPCSSGAFHGTMPPFRIR
ncbi:MAG: Cell wall-associated hydrolase (invasion-associated protein) [Chloroflexi bacterium]|nr:Cell wall-associated hydrolase (invasion-associated protein) [Chloroflexota bacterium]